MIESGLRSPNSIHQAFGDLAGNFPIVKHSKFQGSKSNEPPAQEALPEQTEKTQSVPISDKILPKDTKTPKRRKKVFTISGDNFSVKEFREPTPQAQATENVKREPKPKKTRVPGRTISALLDSSVSAALDTMPNKTSKAIEPLIEERPKQTKYTQSTIKEQNNLNTLQAKDRGTTIDTSKLECGRPADHKYACESLEMLFEKALSEEKGSNSDRPIATQTTQNKKLTKEIEVTPFEEDVIPIKSLLDTNEIEETSQSSMMSSATTTPENETAEMNFPCYKEDTLNTNEGLSNMMSQSCGILSASSFQSKVVSSKHESFKFKY